MAGHAIERDPRATYITQKEFLLTWQSAPREILRAVPGEKKLTTSDELKRKEKKDKNKEIAHGRFVREMNVTLIDANIGEEL